MTPNPDIFIGYIYELIFRINQAWSYVTPLLLLQYPYAREMAIGKLNNLILITKEAYIIF
jgi:hypothetical protein